MKLYITLGLIVSTYLSAMDTKQAAPVLAPIDYSFKIVAILKMSLTNPYATTPRETSGKDVSGLFEVSPDFILANFSDSLIEGGLINPTIKHHENQYKFSPTEASACMMKIKVRGHVSADGIAAPNEEKKAKLQAVILGCLKELRQNHNPQRAKAFLECIKKEFTSKKDADDTGLRTDEAEGFLKEHVPACINEKYKGLRIGEYIRLNVLNGNDDPHASITLAEFNIYA